MNKKIPVGLAVALMALVAAISVLCSTAIVQNKFNDVLIDFNERQAMYDKLGELDKFVRTNSTTDINEQALVEALCRGYIDGLNNSNFTYMTATEFNQSNIVEDDSIKILRLSDGSVLIIQQVADNTATISN